MIKDQVNSLCQLQAAHQLSLVWMNTRMASAVEGSDAKRFTP